MKDYSNCVIKSAIVEFQVDAGSTLARFNFGLQQFLKSKEIISLEAIAFADNPVAPSGNPIFTGAVLKGSYLQLYGANPEDKTAMGIWLDQIPWVCMHWVQNGTDPFVREKYVMYPRVIVWEKSFFEFGTAPAPGANTSYVLNVGYIGNEGDN